MTLFVPPTEGANNGSREAWRTKHLSYCQLLAQLLPLQWQERGDAVKRMDIKCAVGQNERQAPVGG